MATKLTKEQIQILKEHIIIYQVTTFEQPPLIIVSQAYSLIEVIKFNDIEIPTNIDLVELRISIYDLTGNHKSLISEICNKESLRSRINLIPLRLKADLVNI